MGAADPFLLGLASGVGVLTITAYRHISPPWLKFLLIANGALVAHRYALIMQWAGPGTAPPTLLSSWWAIRAIGFTLPGVFAIDQLIRHPAMTPKKLLRWYGTCAVVAGTILLLAHASGWFTLGHLLVLVGFIAGIVGMCMIMSQKIPIPSVRGALLSLMLAYGLLGTTIIMVASERWPDAILLFPEMLTLVVLWYVYETGARLQASGG